MLNEKCKEGNHSWSCLQVQGNLGEIKKIKSLTPKEVEQISSNPNNLNDNLNAVCPGGMVICEGCEKPFREDQGLPKINLQDLRDQVERRGQI